MFLSECRQVMPQQQNEGELESNATSESDDFSMAFATRRLVRQNSIDQDIELEINKYFSDTRTHLEMLDDYPTIRKVYFKFNTTLSSSGAVERLFSQSSLIFTPRRNRILPSNFEYCLLLHHNKGRKNSSNK